MKKKGKELKWMLVTEYTPEEEDGQQMVLEGMEDKRTKPVRVTLRKVGMCDLYKTPFAPFVVKVLLFLAGIACFFLSCF